MVRDFDYNEFPLAYLITVRCYGTWLHGDKRGSMNRQDNAFGTPRVPPNSQLQYFEIKELKHPAVTFNAHQRGAVRRAIREVCAHREYHLRAINVRTNHAHIVVTAFIEPEPIMEAFKAYATRALRQAGLLASFVRPWARHGSTIYLWKERHVEQAVEYVVNDQGEDLPRFE